MNQIKDIELSESSFQGVSFPEVRNYFSSYTQSIFTKKLAEMKKNKMSSNRYPQNSRSNEGEGYNDVYETPRKDSNNVLSKDFFSPRSTKMLRDYTLSEKLRIKWLRSIRDYMKLQEMQVVYNYLKTANVKVLIRELRLRKCFSLWSLKFREHQKRQKWENFASFLVKKQRTEIFNINAAKTRKTRAALAKASVNKEVKKGDGIYGVNEKIDEFAERTVENMLQPILALKPSEKQNSSNHSHHHQHRKKQQSNEINEPVKTRGINIVEDRNENENQTNENQTNEKTVNENEILERRISDCERRIKEQEQYIQKIIRLFTIISIALGVVVFIFGLVIGRSIVSNKKNINTFINSQTAITQELTAEVADFRIALTKMSGLNKTVVPAVVEASANLTDAD